ncbi:tetrahydromethanopterin S-methyltransferase subunit H [Methanococcus voltae]|jgi:tetrahydromethanopterin S-methyltransferase subunit H|uniref:Tetrahydromethanopterin S-methyltransferase subunit H n=1 Tax=Methanococcus voltae (strain ATCC BAA-1334 / A3) TaxID=456320 RepID=D7DUI3_METV3|nr:tetrahydromethanopterin S-methyltransferase subunit H [Methanococcus voltae]MCS3900593.1 tetrahydromethanopterin S-methyltransferase subunit H [Methanococcus voltae]
MFKFDKEQEIIELAGARFGGQPGECPTALSGTIFYARHKIVEDAKKGIFDKAAAEELINKQAEMQDITGNSALVQVFGGSEEALVNYIDFVADVWDGPMLLDSTSGKARMAAATRATEAGFAGQCVYNSINVSMDEEEFQNLVESDLEASIVLCFDPMDPSVEGKLNVLNNGGKTAETGMLELAEKAGIKHPLIDVAVTPMGNGAGQAVRASFAVKAKLGLPVGSGIHNIPSAWDWLREFRKGLRENDKAQLSKDVHHVCDIGANIVQTMASGDFVLYGPIDNSQLAFPAVAMTDMIIAETAKDLGTTPDEIHPLHKLI